MSVVEAVEKELERAGAGSALGETALALARELDGESSATSKSMCAKSLVDVLRELRAVAPPREEKDDLHDLRARREKRRSAPARSARP